jgi:hypothetical protein
MASLAQALSTATIGYIRRVSDDNKAAILGKVQCNPTLRDAVPEISRFLGIVVTMYYDDHVPAHFHVRYGEHRARVGIDPPIILAGSLPPRTWHLVLEWASLHRDELREDWTRARDLQPLLRIAPLE